MEAMPGRENSDLARNFAVACFTISRNDVLNFTKSRRNREGPSRQREGMWRRDESGERRAAADLFASPPSRVRMPEGAEFMPRGMTAEGQARHFLERRRGPVWDTASLYSLGAEVLVSPLLHFCPTPFFGFFFLFLDFHGLCVCPWSVAGQECPGN